MPARGLLAVLVAAELLAWHAMTIAAEPLPQTVQNDQSNSDDIIAKHEYGRLGVPRLGNDVPEMGRAAARGDVATLRRLISSGANVEDCSKDKRTPLLLAAAYGQQEAVVILSKAGANINVQDRGGDTALHWAARRGEAEVALFLIKHSAHIDVQNEDKETPLILAAAVGNSAIIQALIDSGANRELADEDGRTAKAWAEMNKHSDIVLQLDQGAQRK